MKIYRFVPDIRGYAHPPRGGFERWWPKGIELGRWMDDYHASETWGQPHADGYDASEWGLLPSDFPLLSLQVPLVSERAAERLGIHPDHKPGWPELAGRLRPTSIGAQRFFAIQPLLEVRGEPNAFVPEASTGIVMPRGEVLYYHTLVFEPSRLRGEFFTIPAHEPYAETYVTEVFVERARSAGLTGIKHLELELVFDDGPIPPRHTPPTPEALRQAPGRRDLEWELFLQRGSIYSYFYDVLEEYFNRAVADGLLSIQAN